MTCDPSAEPWAPLSGTKLRIPELPSYHVKRPRLQQRLESATSAAVTCICASAGSGKTSMAAEWATARGEIGWLSLDAQDNDPNTF